MTAAPDYVAAAVELIPGLRLDRDDAYACGYNAALKQVGELVADALCLILGEPATSRRELDVLDRAVELAKIREARTAEVAS